MRGLELGKAFADAEVAGLYRFRSGYPAEVFAILQRLMVEPRVVLDAGCGTGAIARHIARTVERIDAVDPSEAMLVQAVALPGGSDPNVRWIRARAEDAPLAGPYGLIVAGASLHWMEWDVVLPRFRAALAPGARLAIVDTETTHSEGPLRDEILAIIKRYEPEADHIETREMVDTLVQRGSFLLEGIARTAPMPFEQTVDEYFYLLSSTSTLSGVTLGDRAATFEAEYRAAFARHRVERITSSVVGLVAWGRPA